MRFPSAGRVDSIKLAVWQLGDLERLEELTGEARAPLAGAR